MKRFAVAAALALAGALPAGPAAAAVQLVQVGDFTAPIAVTGPPGDGTRLYVAERTGVVHVIRDGQVSTFVDLSSQVAYVSDEGGFLNLTLAPDFATSGTFYVYLDAKAQPGVARTGDVVVARMHATSPDRADPASFQPVLDVPHDASRNHNGGGLAFGPDGYLYASTGDGNGGDAADNARNLDSADPPVVAGTNHDPRLGKLLRMDVAGSGTAVPAPGNPFVSRGPLSGLIWGYGLRNPFRLSFDRQTGDLVLGDVGQFEFEEIDHVPAGTPGGIDFGWHDYEGLHVYTGTNTPGAYAPDQGAVHEPSIEKSHDGDHWYAIVGGVVVRDPGLPELAGRYVYGDYAKGELWSAQLAADGGRATGDARIPGLPAVSQLSAFGEDACGRVYVTSLGGPVYRLGPSETCAPLGGPAPPGGPGPGPVAPGPGTRAPRLTFGTVPAQRILKTHDALVPVRCDVQCTLRLTGKVTVAGAPKVSVGSVGRTVAANTRVTLVMAVGVKGRRAIAAGLRRHRDVAVAVRATVSDTAGNRAVRTLHVRAKR